MKILILQWNLIFEVKNVGGHANDRETLLIKHFLLFLNR